MNNPTRYRLETGRLTAQICSIICHQKGAKGMVNTGRKKSHSKRRWFLIPHVDVVLSIKSLCPLNSKWNWCVIWKIPKENMKMSYGLKTPINPCTCVALIRLSCGQWPLPAAAMAPPPWRPLSRLGWFIGHLQWLEKDPLCSHTDLISTMLQS